MRKLFYSLPFKLSLRFSILLSAVTLVFSVAFTFAVSFVLRAQKSDELEEYAELISKTLEEKKDEEIAFSSIPYYMTYLLYAIDWDNNLEPKVLSTNDPYLPCLAETDGKAKIFYDEDYFLDGAMNILYFVKSIQLDNDFIFIQTALNMDTDSSSKIVRQIPKVALIAFIPVLLLSFLFSMLITKRTIKPVLEMSATARHIGSSNLDTMLPLSSTKVQQQNELDELAVTFNELFGRLKKDFDREKQFTSDVSHELKTPVAVILGQANLLRRWGKDDPNQLEKSLASIIAETKSMEAIITNLLQMSRLESGRVQPELEKVDLQALFTRMKEETLSVNPQVEFEIKGFFDEGDLDEACKNIFVLADLELLHQVLTVITSNSLKFCKFAGISPIKLVMSAQLISKEEEESDSKESKRDFCLLSILDNGPGFPEDALTQVFDRFYRADSAHTRSAGGSGLGLSIAKTIIESMNGKIRAKNAQSGGAEIQIILPL
ncbi:MAG: HAMP domain-containing histidine kinase [Treponema sp.]|nr:HAMP domain-containing histidine kinase [Treponema sp.]